MAEKRVIAQHKWLTLGAGYNDEPFVQTQPGVYIVPLNYAGEVLLIREPAIYNSELVLGLPGGVIEEGESPAEAANRELQEEIGYRADVLFPLGMIQPLARYADWNIYPFLARNLVPSRRIGDEVYQIETERVPLADFETLITSGWLHDSNVIAVLYMARQFVGGKLVYTQP